MSARDRINIPGIAFLKYRLDFMTRSIEIKIRLLAATSYLIGLIWIPISMAIAPLIKIDLPEKLPGLSTDRLFAVYYPLLISTAIGTLIALLLSILWWKKFRTRHDFIDRSGWSAITLLLNCCTITLLCASILGITCGMGTTEFGKIFVVFLSIPFVFVMSIIYPILALRGAIWTGLIEPMDILS